jgi:hypothetical protein
MFQECVAYTKDKGGMFLQNYDNHEQEYLPSQRRRP